MRVAAGVAGVLVALLALLCTLGTALAAPVGMWLSRRRAVRRGRRVSTLGSWFSAVFAASVLIALVFGVVFALIPHAEFQRIQEESAESQGQRKTPLPDWYVRAFPQAAATDSVTRRAVQSPGFLMLSAVIGVLFAAVFFGVFAGSLGWVATRWLTFAFTGRG